MERDLAGARIDRAEFDELAALCAQDTRFPETYEQWLALVEVGEALAADTGAPSDPLDIDVSAFATWCQRVRVHPGFDSLRAFLIMRRRQAADTWYGDLGSPAGDTDSVKGPAFPG